mmetsp:Transcript_32530/g.78947  ORF Transcript_32530/g.78947 Transcript_32530/m.78947 type:complete len:87 (+) Transcript_32530:288-548(+)
MSGKSSESKSSSGTIFVSGRSRNQSTANSTCQARLVLDDPVGRLIKRQSDNLEWNMRKKHDPSASLRKVEHDRNTILQLSCAKSSS